MAWPAIPTWKMHNPSTYVVDSDLRELPAELAERFASELAQWRKRDQKKKLSRKWLSPVQMAILAVHGLFRGLRSTEGGKLGCGIQVSAAAWARRLGCEERAVTKAFEKLKRLGLLKRYPQLIAHEWQDGPAWRARADVRGISYLTDEGAQWLAQHAGKTRRTVVASTWAPGGVRRVVLVAAGLVGKLLETLREKLRRLAHRLSPHKKQDRPEAEDSDHRKRKTEAARSSPVGNASARGFPRRAQASSQPGAQSPAAGTGPALADRQRLRELFDAGTLTPWNAWPEFWGPPLKKFEPRQWRHHAAERECEKWIARFEIETGATGRTQPMLQWGRA